MKSLGGQIAIGALLIVTAIVFWTFQDTSSIQRPTLPRIATASTVLVAWIGFTTLRARRRSLPDRHDTGGILIVHASQTGFATEIAGRTADALRSAGLAVDLRAIDGVTTATLTRAGRALFVVSTTGEGDAPDHAAAFRVGAMRASLPLHGLAYGVLAFGDRDYADFCAFGRELDDWLRTSGAVPLFDRVEVDNGDEGALRHWQHQLGYLAGASVMPDWTRPVYQPWRLLERNLLNPGSVGGPCFHIALTPEDATHLTWEAGDIVEIGPRKSPGDETPLPHREYSIASVPADGALHLVVRQMRADDGSLGWGSGWLTEHAPAGGVIDVRVRRNASFHAPADDRPVLLIGNGTGIAGLRALIKTRVAKGHLRNWVLFGERHSGVDRLHVDDLERWHEAGGIERLDLVWSREARGSRYVQDRLLAAADDLRRFVDEGASVYVCGSLVGMARGVDSALRAVMGDAAVNDLASSGRYRRDVY